MELSFRHAATLPLASPRGVSYMIRHKPQSIQPVFPAAISAKPHGNLAFYTGAEPGLKPLG
jgi:hypothetical protein